ncbi:autotransporter domain-containing protein [Bradyrhizobium australiense]|uniref:Autotransporter outer membrane beta-barrel domain-containing protein n=1 Tax=Bradyrhizobium australiense TaxID=2721161 RepID=A0A7Y4GXL5_9BRAD|nr:autotransporter domain-containing protein [Bradyrhizobium australiense]NOJ43552.1 autotransporter outer membrane beta-barrel domain-containing protein [Bradyrhizobium australiense]
MTIRRKVVPFQRTPDSPFFGVDRCERRGRPSGDVAARVWGVVCGVEYKVGPNTPIGFVLAGDSTNDSLAKMLGSGSADLFQAGAFGRRTMRLAVVLGYDVISNRMLAGFDPLQVRVKAETFAARFEGGYRFATPGRGHDTLRGGAGGQL